MSALENYNKLKKELTDVQSELQKLYVKQTKLNKQQHALVGDILLEENLLNDEPWEMEIDKSTNIWLNGGDCCNSADDIVKRTKLFSTLGSTNWGDFNYTSEELNISIRGSDGEVYLGFIDSSKAVETIKKLGIEVDYSAVNKACEEAEALAKLYTNVMNSIEELDN